MRIKLTEELWKEGNMYVSYCLELDIASCGESVEQAKKKFNCALPFARDNLNHTDTKDALTERNSKRRCTF